MLCPWAVSFCSRLCPASFPYCFIAFLFFFSRSWKDEVVGWHHWLNRICWVCSVAKSYGFCNPMDCCTPGFPVLHFLPEFAQTHVHWVRDAPNCLIFCLPLVLLFSVFPNIRVFSSESALCIRWSKFWSFSFSISPSNEYLVLISFTIDWFDLAVQETLKSLLQHHNSKASVLWCSFFYGLSHLYMTNGKNIALTIWTFVDKVISAFEYTMFVITFLPRHKHLLISWLQSLSALNFKLKKLNSVTLSIFPLLFPMKW